MAVIARSPRGSSRQNTTCSWAPWPLAASADTVPGASPPPSPSAAAAALEKTLVTAVFSFESCARVRPGQTRDRPGTGPGDAALATMAHQRGRRPARDPGQDGVPHGRAGRDGTGEDQRLARSRGFSFSSRYVTI